MGQRFVVATFSCGLATSKVVLENEHKVDPKRLWKALAPQLLLNPDAPFDVVGEVASVAFGTPAFKVIYKNRVYPIILEGVTSAQT